LLTANDVLSASAFFEFTGKKYPKAKHRFALNGAQGNHPPAFAMLTTMPGPDVEARRRAGRRLNIAARTGDMG
jgi:hypothetical protein